MRATPILHSVAEGPSRPLTAFAASAVGAPDAPLPCPRLPPWPGPARLLPSPLLLLPPPPMYHRALPHCPRVAPVVRRLRNRTHATPRLPPPPLNRAPPAEPHDMSFTSASTLSAGDSVFVEHTGSACRRADPARSPATWLPPPWLDASRRDGDGSTGARLLLCHISAGYRQRLSRRGPTAGWARSSCRRRRPKGHASGTLPASRACSLVALLVAPLQRRSPWHMTDSQRAGWSCDSPRPSVLNMAS